MLLLLLAVSTVWLRAADLGEQINPEHTQTLFTCSPTQHLSTFSPPTVPVSPAHV